MGYLGISSKLDDYIDKKTEKLFSEMYDLEDKIWKAYDSINDNTSIDEMKKRANQCASDIKKVKSIAYGNYSSIIKDCEDWAKKSGISETEIKNIKAYITEYLKQSYYEIDMRVGDCWSLITDKIKIKEKELKNKSNFNEKPPKEKAYGRFNTRADSSEYAEFQAHKIVSAAYDKVFRR